MRSWMSEGTGYQQGIPLGEVMRSGGIARVLESRAEAFAPGDLVQARLGWQTHPTIPGRYLQKLDLALGSAEDWIGPLGLSAVTAYFGLRDIGGLRPNDRVLVSTAAGGVGQVAVQIARIEGCRVWASRGGRRSAPSSRASSARTRRSTTRRSRTCPPPSPGAACGAGGVMAWERGAGKGREGEEGVDVGYAPNSNAMLCGCDTSLAGDSASRIRSRPRCG